MITGKPRPDSQEPDPYEIAHISYHADLDRFVGVEGVLYGFTDEFANLRELIRDTGIMVLEAEAAFKQVQADHPEEEGGPSPSPEQLKLWHKSTYRRFTYKSLLMLIQSTFETRIVEFTELMVEHKQMTRTNTKDDLSSLFSELRQMDPKANEYYKLIQPFTRIRNKITHLDGKFYKKDLGNDFIKFAESQPGLSIEQIQADRMNPRYQIKVSHSSLFFDYIKLAEDICNRLAGAARVKTPVV